MSLWLGDREKENCLAALEESTGLVISSNFTLLMYVIIPP